MAAIQKEKGFGGITENISYKATVMIKKEGIKIELFKIILNHHSFNDSKWSKFKSEKIKAAIEFHNYKLMNYCRLDWN